MSSSQKIEKSSRKIGVVIHVIKIGEEYYAVITYPQFCSFGFIDKEIDIGFHVRGHCSEEEMPNLFARTKEEARKRGIPHVINLDDD